MKKLFFALAALLAGTLAFAQETQQEAQPEYGYKQTGFQKGPKVGGYIIGGYKHSDKDGANGGPGFTCRLIRLYADGTIFDDFKYRLQLQVNGASPHTKDFYLEWAKYKAFSVKIGQFKRAFTFENPMNPWDVGVGDYSFLVQKFAGMGDRLGEANMGGRDLGVQIQGDFLPIGEDKHTLLHYQLGLWNGQGINANDKDKKKDIIGTLQVQPIKGLKVGVFGWAGNWIDATGTNWARERVSAGVFYDKDNWTVRAEYAATVGAETRRNGNQTADALYLTVGVPVQDWFKVYAKWDEYRGDATSATAHDMYSVCANFRLHKNLNFQLEYRHHEDQNLAVPGFNELWFLTYVRF